MALIETCLTVLGAVSGAAGLHSWYTGLKAGGQMEYVLRELQKTRGEVERLSDHILYVPSIQQVWDVTRTRQDKLTDGREIREFLDPIQQGFGEDILSTAVLSTPQKLREMFRQDPWDALFDIRPIRKVRKPTNPDAVPILFLDDGDPYIGWQMKGMLRTLFDCEYDATQLVITSSDITQGEVEGIRNQSKASSPKSQARSSPVTVGKASSPKPRSQSRRKGQSPESGEPSTSGDIFRPLKMIGAMISGALGSGILLLWLVAPFPSGEVFIWAILLLGLAYFLWKK